MTKLYLTKFLYQIKFAKASKHDTGCQMICVMLYSKQYHTIHTYRLDEDKPMHFVKTKCVVQMTLTIYDEDLCKKIEPNVCTTKERVAVLKTLHDLGIPTVVWLSPILPFINDTEENIMGLLNYCIEAKVYGIICFGMGLTLREGNREYFYQKLDENFPGLRNKYQEKYGEIPNQFAADAYDAIYAIKAAAEKAGLTPDMSVSDMCDAMKVAMTEITIDGLTGNGITWTSEGEPSKEPKAMVIKDGAYTSM